MPSGSAPRRCEWIHLPTSGAMETRSASMKAAGTITRPGCRQRSKASAPTTALSAIRIAVWNIELRLVFG